MNSVRTIGVALDKVDIEINLNNDGSRGQVYAYITAKSNDGILKSWVKRGTSILPIGKNIIVTSVVVRPPIFDKQATDILQVELFEVAAIAPFLKQKFQNKIIWDAMEKPTAGETIANTTSFKKDLSRLEMYAMEFRENYQDEEFTALDIQIEKLNKSRELSESGEWLLAQFQYEMEQQFQAASDSPALARIKKWNLLKDKSVGAVIAEAMYFREKAWKIRGGRNNRNPSPLASQLFGEQIAKAEKILLSARKFTSHNPLWHQALLTISSEQGKSNEAIRKLFDEGVKAFPNYRGLYSTMALHYAPRYGKADWTKVDEIVQLSVANTEALEGMSNYAAVYQDIFDKQLVEFSPFDQSMVNWSSMKRGYVDLIKRHPISRHKNKFAASACQANDAKAFSVAMAQIGIELSSTHWPSNYSPDLCKNRFSMTIRAL